ncbi:MAG TPA: hypothetical protein VJB57_17405, partial [Dehalococcoidia bacterium]|nr:hypothetical protein [Dehalococcoidia bacterium]
QALLSWLVTAAVALSATAFVYSTEVYPEVPAALCIVLSLLVLRRERLAVLDGVYLAVLVSTLAWLSEKYVFIGCLLAVFFLIHAGWPARRWFVILSAVGGAVYVWFHLAVFGHLTAYSVNTVYEGASSLTVLDHHFSFGDRVYRIYGLFIDRRFGIGRWAPLFLLVLPALPLLLSKGGIKLVAAGLILLQTGIASFLAITMMGFWFPGRTLMAVVPLFSLVIVTLLTQLPMMLRWGVATLALLSVLTTVALTEATRSGEVRLAVAPFDMQAPGFQLAGRLFPNYQAWNLETVVLTLAWLALLAAGLIWSLRRSPLTVATVSRLQQVRHWPRLTAPGHSSVVPPP